MLRMRGLRLLAVMTFTLALATTGFAWPGNGGGKGGGGGGGEDPPPEPPPISYEISILPWLGNGDLRNMNEFGDLVGSYFDANGDRRAYLYTDGLGFVTLDSLLPADSDWTLRTANAVNNQGVIVGSGRLPGDVVSRPYRLTLNGDGTVTIDDLGKFHPDDSAPPRGINDSGEIMGTYHPRAADARFES